MTPSTNKILIKLSVNQSNFDRMLFTDIRFLNVKCHLINCTFWFEKKDQLKHATYYNKQCSRKRRELIIFFTGKVCEFKISQCNNTVLFHYKPKSILIYQLFDHLHSYASTIQLYLNHVPLLSRTFAFLKQFPFVRFLHVQQMKLNA